MGSGGVGFNRGGLAIPMRIIPTDIFNKCADSIFKSSFFFRRLVKFKQLRSARQRICATAFRDVMCRIGLIKHERKWKKKEKKGWGGWRAGLSDSH